MKERDDDALVSARARVADNPTDLALRFELGRILFARNCYKEAIAELQRARQHPGLRRDAMMLLAESYEAVGLSAEGKRMRQWMDTENLDDDEDEGESGAPSRKPVNPNQPSPGSENMFPPLNREDPS